VEAALLIHLCGCRLYLHLAPAAAKALSGFTVLGLTVANATALHAWATYLDRMGVAHSTVRQAHLGLTMTVTAPDELGIQLRTREPLSGDET
jgi:hypothetical protein